jgi:hypothetical protein
MFVIVTSSAKSNIGSKEYVCLSKINKIQTYSDKIRLSFDSIKALYRSKVELRKKEIEYESVFELTLEFKYKQVITIIP